jgi:hypothetical protein
MSKTKSYYLSNPSEETQRLMAEWQKEADSQADMYKDKQVCREYEEWMDRYDIGGYDEYTE